MVPKEVKDCYVLKHLQGTRRLSSRRANPREGGAACQVGEYSRVKRTLLKMPPGSGHGAKEKRKPRRWVWEQV